MRDLPEIIAANNATRKFPLHLGDLRLVRQPHGPAPAIYVNRRSEKFRLSEEQASHFRITGKLPDRPVWQPYESHA